MYWKQFEHCTVHTCPTITFFSVIRGGDNYGCPHHNFWIGLESFIKIWPISDTFFFFPRISKLQGFSLQKDANISRTNLWSGGGGAKNFKQNFQGSLKDENNFYIKNHLIFPFIAQTKMLIKLFCFVHIFSLCTLFFSDFFNCLLKNKLPKC